MAAPSGVSTFDEGSGIMKVAVLGGGSTAYACAADLALRGHAIRMFSSISEELQPIRKANGIKASGVISGFAEIEAIVSEIGDLLDRAELVLLNVSAGGFETYAGLIAQNAKKALRIASFGKGGAALIIARVARELGTLPPLIVAEGNSALYLCRRQEDAEVWIGHITREVVTAAFPSRETTSALLLLHDLFPDHKFAAASNVVETILLDYNALLHPGPMICNASSVERTAEGFGLFRQESITQSVVNIVEALDRERLALCRVLDIEAVPLEAEFHRQGFTERGTPLLECLHTELLAQLPGPFSLTERHLSEDVPYGLVAWYTLGELLGVATPVAHACCVVASVLNQEDYLLTGASAQRSGLDRSWGATELKRYLSEGSR